MTTGKSHPSGAVMQAAAVTVMSVAQTLGHDDALGISRRWRCGRARVQFPPPRYVYNARHLTDDGDGEGDGGKAAYV